MAGESSCFILSSQVAIEVLLSFFDPCTSYYERERRKKVDAALESAKERLIAVIDRKTRGMGPVARRFVPVGALSENIIARCTSNPKFDKLTPDEQLYFAEELFEHGCRYCYRSPPGEKEVERHVQRFADAVGLEIVSPPPEDKYDVTAQREERPEESDQSSLLRLAMARSAASIVKSSAGSNRYQPPRESF